MPVIFRFNFADIVQSDSFNQQYQMQLFYWFQRETHAIKTMDYIILLKDFILNENAKKEFLFIPLSSPARVQSEFQEVHFWPVKHTSEIQLAFLVLICDFQRPTTAWFFIVPLIDLTLPVFTSPFSKCFS